jgi:anti-sigma-K factor RskA
LNITEHISSGIIEQYVMGLCSDVEKNEVEILRKQDIAFNNAVVNFEIQFEQQQLNYPINVATSVDENILQQLNILNKIESKPIATTPTKVVSISFAKVAAAAAVMIACASLYFNVEQYNNNKAQAILINEKNKITPEVTLPIADYNILKNPSITPVAMIGQGSHTICRCTMFWDKKTGKAYVMVHHLFASGEEYDYQLWAIVNGKKVSVGIIDDKIRDRFVALDNTPNSATEFLVTLEKRGGAAVPNEDVILKGVI